MTNESKGAIQTMSLQTKGQESSYRINQHLQKGAYQLIITAPFDTRVAVTPLNPPAGFQFHPDQDGTAEIWNSRIVTPQDGQYTFLIRMDKPVDNSQLYIQFILQEVAPPVEPPPVPPPQPPQPPQPPSAPPGDMQEYYRQRGYRIVSDGAVEFYFVTFRTNKKTRQQELCLAGTFAWSDDLHDPARKLQRLREEDKTYRYNRAGPFANRGLAEQSAISFAIQIFNDPTRYGIFGTGGLRDIKVSDYRDPKFR
jgi:hypothetical protein